MTEITEVPCLSAASPGLALPYDRARVTPGIVHIGIGAFHRAHMAAYIDQILAADPSWGIVGASLRRPDTRAALAPQDFLYSLAIRSGSGTSVKVIGALLDVIDGNPDREALLAAMADPRIRIVSMTVTEKGYCHDPATGTLHERHPDVIHDLAHPNAPVSVPGLIVAALARRRAAGIPPFTVLCCDNLPANGETTRRVVMRFAELSDPDLAAFIAREVAFPSTMVDRIVPATTDEDRAIVASATGFADAWPVVTEPFTQWVIEDHFTAGRPPLETVGVQFAEDVKPYELMKLRMLNGSHSTMAYLGYLGGYEYVNQAIADPGMRILIHGLMTGEVMGTLPPGLPDLAGYRDALLERFANPALKHRTWQIAMDGSQKLPQRLLGTIRDRLARGEPIQRAGLGVAAWMRYVTGTDERGNPIEVKDPRAADLRAIADAAGRDPDRLIDGLLGITEIFGDDLPRDETFRATLSRHVTSLFEIGSLATIARVNAGG